MKMLRLSLRYAAILTTGCALHGQITLTGLSYAQDFNTIGAGLPAGWSVHTATTLNTLGAAATFTNTATTWASGTALTDFRNVSSDNIPFGSTSGTQSSNSNRALGWRPLAAATESRTGAIMLTLANTEGFVDFSLNLRVFTGNDSSASSQIYSFEYRVGDTGNFTPIATYVTPTTGATGFNAQIFTADPMTLSALNDQSETVYFRLRGTTTTGTSLDSIAIDDFSLSYSLAAIPEPSTYAGILGTVAVAAAVLRRRQSRHSRTLLGT